MTLLLDVVVVGLPAPQGSKRGFVRGGKAQLVEQSKNLPQWRQDVIAQVRKVWAGKQPATEALALVVNFYLPRPRSHYRTNGELKHNAPPVKKVRPDGDKLLRAVMDALTTAGVFADDALVVDGHFIKRYICHTHPTPGARVVLRHYEDEVAA